MHKDRFSLNGSAGHGGKDELLLARNRKAQAAVSPILDQINQKFAEAEKNLKALQPSEAVWTSYGSEPLDWRQPGKFLIIKCLGFMLHKGQWRLCYGYHADCEPGPDDNTWQTLVESPRSVRLEVATSFPKLYYELQQRIVNANEAEVPEAQKALEKMIVALG